ncbi:hypothetical protein JCM9279_003445 [Rhodotorula babjevae]
MPVEMPAISLAAASPALADAHAELVSPPTDKASGWSRLPLELREKVVEDVPQVIEDEGHARATNPLVAVAVGFFEVEYARCEDLRRVQVEKRCALERLQAVNRDFRSLCTPHLWQDISLDLAGPTRAPYLERLLDVLPSHASHVRCFDAGGYIRSDDDYPDSEAQALRYEYKLVMQALRLCKNVRRVEHGYVQCDYPDFEMPAVEYMALVGPKSLTQILHRPIPINLTSLKLVDKEDESDVGGILGPVILLPSLKHLFICTNLEDAFFEMALKLSAGAHTVARLESLELYSPSTSISYGPLHGFVTKFASSLVTLRLNLPPLPFDDAWNIPAKQAFHLPHLHSLFLSTGFLPELFLKFTSSRIPLRILHVGYCPFLYGDVDPLVNLLRNHPATLKRVHIARTPEDYAGYFWAQETEQEFQMSLQDYVDLTIVCRGLGVAYSIEEPEDYVADDENMWELPSRYDEDSQDGYDESDEWDEDSEEEEEEEGGGSGSSE